MPYVLAVEPGRSGGASDGPGRRRPDEAFPSLLAVDSTMDGAFRGVLGGAGQVVAVVLQLARSGDWTIGVGAGDRPSAARPGSHRPADTAFLRAHRALETARQRPAGIAVEGPTLDTARDAQALLAALVVLVQRRTRPAWEAIDLILAGRTQAQAAVALGISRQAVGQRLATALWDLERELRPSAVRLLDRAAEPAVAV